MVRHVGLRAERVVAHVPDAFLLVLVADELGIDAVLPFEGVHKPLRFLRGFLLGIGPELDEKPALSFGRTLRSSACRPLVL